MKKIKTCSLVNVLPAQQTFRPVAHRSRSTAVVKNMNDGKPKPSNQKELTGIQPLFSSVTYQDVFEETGRGRRDSFIQL